MKCSARDCPYDAKWRPVLLLRPRVDYDGPAFRMQVGIGVCDEHRGSDPRTAAELFITDESWKTILKIFDGLKKARPHRSFTRVEFIPLDSPEAMEFEERIR